MLLHEWHEVTFVSMTKNLILNRQIWIQLCLILINCNALFCCHILLYCRWACFVYKWLICTPEVFEGFSRIHLRSLLGKFKLFTSAALCASLAWMLMLTHLEYMFNIYMESQATFVLRFSLLRNRLFTSVVICASLAGMLMPEVILFQIIPLVRGYIVFEAYFQNTFALSF